MFEDLKSKTALVTGAYSGLGRHFALRLAESGARVALCGRRTELGETLATEIRARGGQACVAGMDVTQPDSVQAAFTLAEQALGPVDIVINNAGIAMTRPALEISEDEWTGLIDVNLNGAWRVAQCAARHFQRHGRPGAIVNIASILGQRVASHVAAYTAAKAGLLHLTRALALEWARHGIRVNALAPGYIGTDLNREFFATPAGEALVKRIPQRRLGTPQDLDGPLLLLSSDASAYMTGAVIDVDGGHLASSL
ncbi:SDR family NAD(P)-dependent oxidoreductase [Achromobacter xylosoxidans]|uniref:SDR family NAD(P)-dependent oxidoreductase n=1 Tax=Alcaligenes xylosoxydans xylosoxydans TaxID=85698 RepID=A0A9X3R5E9_ALCXX|nr:SDR family NAD(P)-dependent oxidoreductase [Achromobacter xylosoxidans]MCZ8403591.1 SDR family NAD(P)-dependent oxidoreductase [Achromobacter xylosoxidans]BEG77034.1 2-dehydro-3-deoxy-D-gluconate 5-dehydrogenase [Achromobacter xylosoxidans]